MELGNLKCRVYILDGSHEQTKKMTLLQKHEMLDYRDLKVLQATFTKADKKRHRA